MPNPSSESLEDLYQLLDAKPGPAWTLIEPGYDPNIKPESESRLSIANGFIGIRGDVATHSDLQRTYIAGHFEPGRGPAAVPGLVPAPAPFPLRITIDGEPLELGRGAALDYTRTLDLRHGLLRTLWHETVGPEQRAQLQALRFVSLADRCLAAQVVRLKLTKPAMLSIEADSPGPRLQDQPAAESEAAEISSLRLAFDRRTLVYADGGLIPGRGRWQQQLESEVVVLQLAVYDLDIAGRALANVARGMRRALRHGFAGLLSRHFQAWGQRWDESEIELDGDEDTRKALLFAVYHLNSVANPRSDLASVAARGLTGDAYMGHVFWDTEVMLLPFYVLTWPRAARAMLMYRYRTLDAARRKALGLGYKGALYAWESTDTGEETAPSYVFAADKRIIFIRTGSLEHHISADVAFAVWRYWLATSDNAFLLAAGAEIIFETARFWASRASLESDGLYHIRGVIGPDEYHEDVDDNAFTNAMARWNLRCALRLSQLISEKWPDRWRALSDRLGLEDPELAEWTNVADSLVILEQPVSGLIEQFAGYFSLEYVDLAPYASRTTPMDVVLGADRVSRSQITKQADVVMLFALLGDEYSLDQQSVNFAFYEPRCGHGSSLSAPVHAMMAARLGDMDLALRYLRQTAAIDLGDTFGNTAGGLHMGALAGLWQAVVFGFAGLELREDGLAFRPRLPADWKRLAFRLRWKGRRIEVTVSPFRLHVTLLGGKPVTVRVNEARHTLSRTRPIDFALIGS